MEVLTLAFFDRFGEPEVARLHRQIDVNLSELAQAAALASYVEQLYEFMMRTHRGYAESYGNTSTTPHPSPRLPIMFCVLRFGGPILRQHQLAASDLLLS